MGSLIGIVASSRLDYQEDVKKEWLARQEEEDMVRKGEGGEEEAEEEPGVSLMSAQMRRARQRVIWNIGRMLLAIAVGTVVLVPVEGWTWG
eukprot:evm.model.NODE_3224_length_23392_cov_40.121708.5